MRRDGVLGVISALVTLCEWQQGWEHRAPLLLPARVDTCWLESSSLSGIMMCVLDCELQPLFSTFTMTQSPAVIVCPRQPTCLVYGAPSPCTWFTSGHCVHLLHPHRLKIYSKFKHSHVWSLPVKGARSPLSPVVTLAWCHGLISTVKASWYRNLTSESVPLN